MQRTAFAGGSFNRKSVRRQSKLTQAAGAVMQRLEDRKYLSAPYLTDGVTQDSEYEGTRDVWLTAQDPDGGAITSVHFDWGDGTSSDMTDLWYFDEYWGYIGSTSHYYSSPGDPYYHATITVTDDQNETSDPIYWDFLAQNSLPTADMSVSISGANDADISVTASFSNEWDLTAGDAFRYSFALVYGNLATSAIYQYGAPQQSSDLSYHTFSASDLVNLVEDGKIFGRVFDDESGYTDYEIQLSFPTLTVTGTSNSQINLSWESPFSDQTGWRVQMSTNGQSFSLVEDLTSAGQSTYSKGGLTEGTKYWFRIRGRGGDVNHHVYSAKQSAYTRLNTPTNPTVTATVAHTLQVAWTDNSTKEQAYDVYRSLAGANSWVLAGSTGANGTSFNDTNRPDETRYDYYVVARNANTTSAASQIASATSMLPTPGTPSANTLSSSSIQITWADNSSTETAFDVFRSLTGTGNWTLAGTKGADQTSFTDIDLADGTKYYYQVQARKNNEAVSPKSASGNATTDLDAATGIEVIAVSGDQIDISWSDESNKEDGYKVYRSANNGSTWTLVETTSASETSISDDGLDDGTEYLYYVETFSSTAVHAESEQASAITLLPTPGTPTVTPFGGGDYQLEWADNSENETGFRITINNGEVEYVTVEPNASSTASYTIEDLSSNLEYSFTIMALGELTSSAPSEAGFTPDPDFPEQWWPTDFSVTDITASNIVTFEYTSTGIGRLGLEFFSPSAGDDNYVLFADELENAAGVHELSLGQMFQPDEFYGVRLRAEFEGEVVYLEDSFTAEPVPDPGYIYDVPAPGNISYSYNSQYDVWTLTFAGDYGDIDTSEYGDYQIISKIHRPDDPYKIYDASVNIGEIGHDEENQIYTVDFSMGSGGAEYIGWFALIDNEDLLHRTPWFGQTTLTQTGELPPPLTLTSSPGPNGYTHLEWSGGDPYLGDEDTVGFVLIYADGSVHPSGGRRYGDHEYDVPGGPEGSEYFAIYDSSPYSNFVDVSPRLSVTPQNFRSWIIGKDKVRLTWDNNSNNESGFIVQRRVHLSNDPWETVEETDSDEVTCEQTLPDPGTVYDFIVRAINFGGVLSAPSTMAVTSGLVLESVAFGGWTTNASGLTVTASQTIARDDGSGVYAGSQWLDGNHNGSIDAPGKTAFRNGTLDAGPSTNEHTYPISYLRSRPGRPSYILAAPVVWFMGTVATRLLRIKGDGGTYTFDVRPALSGGGLVFASIPSRGPLPTFIDSDTLQIDWQISIAGGAYFSVGTSTNHLYVTGDTAPGAYETVLDLGCEGAKEKRPRNPGEALKTGDKHDREVVDGIWTKFKDRDTTRVDGTALVYDPNILGHTASVPLSRSDGKGQCSALADLLFLTLKAHIRTIKQRSIDPVPMYDKFRVHDAPIMGGFLASPDTEFNFHVVVEVGVYADWIFDPSFGVITKKTGASPVESQWEADHVSDFRFPSLTLGVPGGWLGYNPIGNQLMWSDWVVWP